MALSRTEDILISTINDTLYTGEVRSRIEALLVELNESLVSGEAYSSQIATAVNTYLTAHPEATTTVQDGSITAAKLASSYKDTTLGYTVKKSVEDI